MSPYRISFGWGGIRYANAIELRAAQREAVEAAELCNCRVALLDAQSYAELGAAERLPRGGVYLQPARSQLPTGALRESP
jgi:hypothetical protein